MKSVSNQDYEAIISFLLDFSRTDCGERNIRGLNSRRRAWVLAKKLQRKEGRK